MRTVQVVVPGDVADPAVPSGGNTYDRRVCQGLAAAGWSVHERAVPGAWPRPDQGARRALAEVLATVPDGGLVLLDGLVACAAPEVVVPAAVRLRLLVVVHLPLGDEVGLPPDEAASLAALERRTLHAAAAVVTTSSWAAGRVADQHGLPAGRVPVAPPGVDPAPPAPGTATGSRLLCVASLTPLKAQDLLIEALARVADRPWQCTCAGSLRRAPAYARHVQAQVRAYGLADRIRITGPLPDLAGTYAATDLLVHPSRAETYGMVLTEALARGIPVVATDVGGVREAIGQTAQGNVPGLLVPPDDPAALAAALRRWWDEPQTRHQLRQTALDRRDSLAGWDATVRTVSDLLERM